MTFILLRDIEHECVDSPSKSYFPSILDEDSILAAESLTIDDSVIAMNALKEVYSSLVDDRTSKYPYLREAVTYSYHNFIWFASFFKKLQELYGLPGFKVPHEVAPNPSSNKSIGIFPPTFIININNTYKIFYENINLKAPNLLNLHRASYIYKGYELEDFRCGFPNWYMLKATTVFEKYNEKTNKRVKISFQNNEFRYFVCGASDNWQEILDVPLEIDDVISALLFKN